MIDKTERNSEQTIDSFFFEKRSTKLSKSNVGIYERINEKMKIKEKKHLDTCCRITENSI